MPDQRLEGVSWTIDNSHFGKTRLSFNAPVGIEGLKQALVTLWSNPTLAGVLQAIDASAQKLNLLLTQGGILDSDFQSIYLGNPKLVLAELIKPNSLGRYLEQVQDPLSLYGRHGCQEIRYTDLKPSRKPPFKNTTPSSMIAPFNQERWEVIKNHPIESLRVTPHLIITGTAAYHGQPVRESDIVEHTRFVAITTMRRSPFRLVLGRVPIDPRDIVRQTIVDLSNGKRPQA